MINNFNDFVFEYSKNEPIPELRNNKKTAIFLFGAPGVGKSTFAQNYIYPYFSNFKVFNPDILMKKLIQLGKDIRKISEEEKQDKIKEIRKTIQELREKYKLNISLTNDEIIDIINSNEYVPNSYKILDRQLNSYIKNSNSNMVYDTTGNDLKRIKHYTELVKSHDYNVVYIKVVSTIKTAIKSNLGRDRKVQVDYQYKSLKKSYDNKKFIELNPDSFYIFDRNTSFLYKYNGEKFIKIKKIKEKVYESDQIRKINYFNNTPFYGTHGITATPGPYDDEEDEEDEVEGEEPETPKKSKERIAGQKPIKKKKDKKLHFSIDQDDYKRYMKTNKPGKSFGVGT